MSRAQFTEMIGQRRLAPLAAVAGVSALAALFVAGVLAPQLQRPVEASSKQTRAAGAVVFREKGCEHCHGTDGVGTDRGPDLSTIGKRWKKDHIEQQIRDGGGGMPPFGSALQPDEVKSLVDYLAAKRKAPKPPPLAPQPKPVSDENGG